MSEHASAVGRPLVTRASVALAAVFAVALALLAWRFFVGLGAVTAMNDGYPWGLWITYDVVIGTALSTGGYGTALLVYVLNGGKYHPLVRPAMLTSALGYSIAAFSVVIDVGRWWNMWKVATMPWHWNFNSVLLEVALCIMVYFFVLWVEVSPAMLEAGAAQSRWPRLARASARIGKLLDRGLVFIIALGILLPTMHQSSLGSLLLVTVRLDPLWHTPLLPLLFLVSCLAMGYAAVVFESELSSKMFGRPKETAMLATLGRAMSLILGAFLVLRIADIARRWQASFAEPHLHSVMFVLEICMFAAPIAILASKRHREHAGWEMLAAILVMLAGALYRFDAYLVALDPGRGWHYFPSVGEITVTLGLVALEVLAYTVIVKRFPILGGGDPHPA